MSIKSIKLQKTKYYYTMREVCNILDLKPHVLRFWETQFPQLNPQRKQGSNRRYTQKDIQLLKKIQYLLYEKKFKIKGAKKALRNVEDISTKENVQIDMESYESKRALKRLRNKLAELKNITLNFLKDTQKNSDE
ncbi:MerR family transcriptional regulator [bacterium]|nr:MerR family transcriptional regulator [Candidatus Celaenobacter polaris]TSA26725.1 MAG: MerR family transcriptional regulator [bacterium]